MDFKISFVFVWISTGISLDFMDFVWRVAISRGAVATRKVAPADFHVAPVLRRTQSCDHRIETYIVRTDGRRHSLSQPCGLSTCCVTRSLHLTEYLTSDPRPQTSMLTPENLELRKADRVMATTLRRWGGRGRAPSEVSILPC